MNIDEVWHIDPTRSAPVQEEGGGSQNATRKPPRCSYWKWMESGKREKSMRLDVDGKWENREMCLEVDGKRRETGDNVVGSGWEAEREDIM